MWRSLKNQISLLLSLSIPILWAGGALAKPSASEPKYWHEKIDVSIAKKKAMPNYIQINKNARLAVVNIFTTTPDQKESGSVDITGEDGLLEKFFEVPPLVAQQRQSLGSGFIIHEDGYLITNAHLVDKALSVRIFQGLNPQEYSAETIGIDTATDIALLKIRSKGRFPYLYLGNSDMLEVGEWIMAVGNPFGLANTITQGIISGKGRDFSSSFKHGLSRFIQTDASINPGNSGGPMLNYRGEVVGINTALSTNNPGMGFAIPINTAKSVIPKLKEYGRVIRGYLGIVVQSLTPTLALGLGTNVKQGALITEVIAESPAEKAGIKNKDIIVALKGKTIANADEMHSIVGETSPGKPIQIKILRGQEYFTKQVALIESPSREEEKEKPKKPQEFDTVGLSVEDTLPYGSGITIINVSPDGIAQRGGLIFEDLVFEATIKKTDKKPQNFQIKNTADYKKVLEQFANGDILTFLINRFGSPMYVALKY